MEKSKFYEHVSSWISSYYNADALDWLRRFVENHYADEADKQRLLLEIERKVASLKNMPFFGEYEGKQLLMDEHCHPQIFTTRYSCMNKIIQLRQQGYDVRLMEGSVFFRIELVNAEPLELTKAAS